MVEHARAVIIGGGVGGTSIAYHLGAMGWTDVVLLDRAELTSGSTFHSAGLVGQLRSTTTLTRMMMYGADLYRRLGTETGVEVGWHEVGSLRLASTPERMEELTRQAAWARTFGLPLELITPVEAQRLFPLMSIDGVLGAVFLPTDGWLDPSGLALALAAGARRSGVSIRTHARVVGHRGRRRPRDARGRRAGRGDRARSSPTSSSTPAGCSRRRSGRSPACACHRADGARVPVHGPHRGRGAVAPDDARPGQPLLLPRGGRRAVHGRLRADPRAVGARRDPRRLQRPAPGARLAALRGDHGRRHPARARDRRRGHHPDDQRSRGVHARQRVHPRRVRGPRALRGRGLLRARDRRRRRHRAADGPVDRRRRARTGPVAHGRPPLRAAVPLAVVHARTRRSRTTRPTTTSTTRTRSGRPADRSACRPRTRASATSARSSARSPAGSAPTGSRPTRRPATRACGHAGGRAATGRRRSASRRWPRGSGCALRRVLVRQDRGRRARVRPTSCSGCAPATWVGRPGRSRTRRCSTAAAASSATSPSLAWPSTGSWW